MAPDGIPQDEGFAGLPITHQGFAGRPVGEPLDRASRQQRVRAVLMTYCEPKAQYDGYTAWEVAGKVLAVLDEELSDSAVRR